MIYALSFFPLPARIAGDVNKLSPYADAFVGIGKFLAEG